jgi:hypothetical protein
VDIEPDFHFRNAPGWRVTSDMDGRVAQEDVVYRLDVGIREKQVIGYSVEANVGLVADFLNALFRVANPVGEVRVEARSWLEDLGELATRSRAQMPWEAGDAGRQGFYFHCHTDPAGSVELLMCLWPWSSEFTIRFEFGEAADSGIVFCMFPDHVDIAEVLVSARHEAVIESVLAAAA